MYRDVWFVLVALTSLFLAAEGFGPHNHFVNPPPPGVIHSYGEDSTYIVGSTIDLKWRTNYSKISLVLWQDNNASYQYLIEKQPATRFYAWKVNLTGLFSLDQGNGMYNFDSNTGLPVLGFYLLNHIVSAVFSFSILDEDGPNWQFNSHYINITEPFKDSSTPGLTDHGPTPSPSSSSSSSPSAGLSNGAKIGIGVGVGVGVGGILIGLVVGLLLRRKKSKRSAELEGAPASNGSSTSQPALLPPIITVGSNEKRVSEDPQELDSDESPIYRDNPKELPGQSPLHELMNHELPAELPAEDVRAT